MTGTEAHEAVAELVAAWVLNACSPAEDDLVRAHLGHCAVCTREARELREAAADLSGSPIRPPFGAGARVLAAAYARRRPAAAVPAYAAPYAAQVAALDLVLSDLDAVDWRRTAAYGEWSVHDLLAHLTATDGLLAAALGLTVNPPVDPEQSLAARTAGVLAVERERTVEQTRRSWRAQADAVCRALHRPPATPTTITVGWRLSLPDTVLARAFETWIHAADIAAVTGQPTVTPLPEHLHPMADLAARLLPRVIARRMAVPDDQHIRLRLTGAGGGTWTVPMTRSGSTAPAPRVVATLTADVVEFCRLAGGRHDPERFPVDMSGDTALARTVLAAVPDLSGP